MEKDNERSNRRKRGTKKLRKTVLLLPLVKQLGSVQLLQGSGKRSHRLQTIIQCLHLDLLSAPVTRQCDKLK